MMNVTFVKFVISLFVVLLSLNVANVGLIISGKVGYVHAKLLVTVYG